MVFFTCNHCGESVKKPSVEKHYNTKCRGAKKSVSCMDCQKDFQDNYVAHTKCITELQKYSGKDYVPRENQNKGEKRQEGWVETVRGVLDSTEYNLDPKTRSAFEKLQTYNNVPQKKAKFLNFVTNSAHIPRQTVENVWSILEKEQQKLKQARQVELEAAKKEKKSKDKIENKTKAAEADEEPKKKKKKTDAQHTEDAEENKESQNKKRKLEEQKGHSERDDKKKQKENKKTSSTDSGNDYANKKGERPAQNGVESKKEKKQKNKHKQETNGIEEDSVEQHTKNLKPNEVGNIPKENGKAAKKKKNHSSEVVLSNEELQEELVEKKKKKPKANTDDIVENKTQPQENGEEVNVPKKKKKNQDAENNHTDLAETESSLKKKENGIEKNKTSKTEEYKFCWEEAFDDVINKHAEGITIEKFKKKILKKYKTKFEDELTEKQLLGFEKKFNKKLKKNNFFKIEEDIVKSVS